MSNDNFPSSWKYLQNFDAIPSKRYVFIQKESDLSFTVLKSYGWDDDLTLTMDGSTIVVTSKGEFPQFGMLIDTDVGGITYNWVSESTIRISPSYGLNGYITIWLTVET